MPAWKQVRGLEALQPPQPHGDPIAEWTLRKLEDQPGHALTLGPHTIYVTDEATLLFKEEFIHEGLVPEPPPKGNTIIERLLDTYHLTRLAPEEEPAITRLGGAHITHAPDGTATIRPLPALSALATLCQGPEALETALASNPNCTPNDRCPTSIAGIHRLHQPHTPPLAPGLHRIEQAVQQGITAHDQLAHTLTREAITRLLGNTPPQKIVDILADIAEDHMKTSVIIINLAPRIPGPPHHYTILEPIADPQDQPRKTAPYPTTTFQPLHQAAQPNPDPEPLRLYAPLTIQGTNRHMQRITLPTNPLLTIDHTPATIQHATQTTLRTAQQPPETTPTTTHHTLNHYTLTITGHTPAIPLTDTIQRILETIQILNEQTCQYTATTRAIAVTRETRIYTTTNHPITTNKTTIPPTNGYLTDTIHSILNQEPH